MIEVAYDRRSEDRGHGERIVRLETNLEHIIPAVEKLTVNVERLNNTLEGAKGAAIVMRLVWGVVGATAISGFVWVLDHWEKFKNPSQ